MNTLSDDIDELEKALSLVYEQATSVYRRTMREAEGKTKPSLAMMEIALTNLRLARDGARYARHAVQAE